jgi:hypothetical protein
MTLEEFIAEKCPSTLRFYRLAFTAGRDGIVPEAVRPSIEKKIKTEADKLLEAWRKNPRLYRQTFDWRELDPLPRNAVMRAQAVERTRIDITSKIMNRYRGRAERLKKSFAKRLAAARSTGATITALHPNGAWLKLSRSVILGAVVDPDENVLISKGQKWSWISIRANSEGASPNAGYDAESAGDAPVETTLGGVGPSNMQADQSNRSSNRGPSLRQRLASWLRNDGSKYRNAPNKDISAAFKKAGGVEVSEETIRNARNDLGSPPRKRQKRRSLEDDVEIGQRQ